METDDDRCRKRRNLLRPKRQQAEAGPTEINKHGLIELIVYFHTGFVTRQPFPVSEPRENRGQKSNETHRLPAINPVSNG